MREGWLWRSYRGWIVDLDGRSFGQFGVPSAKSRFVLELSDVNLLIDALVSVACKLILSVLESVC